MSLSLLNSYIETDFSQIENYLRGKVQGVPDELVTIAISQALDEFCRETLFWREDMILYPMVGFQEYPVQNVGQTKIVEIIRARYDDGTPLVTGVDWTMLGLSAMVVSEAVIAKAEPIIITAALAPVNETKVMSKMILQQCADWVSNGAAARLLRMAEEYPWSNYKAATVFALQFERDKRKARRMVLNNFMDHHNPLRKHQFY